MHDTINFFLCFVSQSSNCTHIRYIHRSFYSTFISSTKQESRTIPYTTASDRFRNTNENNVCFCPQKCGNSCEENEEITIGPGVLICNESLFCFCPWTCTVCIAKGWSVFQVLRKARACANTKRRRKATRPWKSLVHTGPRVVILITTEKMLEPETLSQTDKHYLFQQFSFNCLFYTETRTWEMFVSLGIRSTFNTALYRTIIPTCINGCFPFTLQQCISGFRGKSALYLSRIILAQ